MTPVGTKMGLKTLAGHRKIMSSLYMTVLADNGKDILSDSCLVTPVGSKMGLKTSVSHRRIMSRLYMTVLTENRKLHNHDPTHYCETRIIHPVHV